MLHWNWNSFYHFFISVASLLGRFSCVFVCGVVFGISRPPCMHGLPVPCRAYVEWWEIPPLWLKSHIISSVRLSQHDSTNLNILCHIPWAACLFILSVVFRLHPRWRLVLRGRCRSTMELCFRPLKSARVSISSPNYFLSSPPECSRIISRLFTDMHCAS